MDKAEVFYKNVLDNMSDGVMTLNLSGRIIMFNPAASIILGFSGDEVIGRSFAEVFMMEMEGNDEFNQTILDAIYESVAGHQATVSFRRRDNVSLTLSVTSSYLRSAEEDAGGHTGVIVVFNDVTKIKELQIAEQELNRQLRDAYRDLEESNKTLNTALKKVQVIRVVVTICVVLLFVGIGFYSWSDGFLKKTSLPLGATTGTTAPGQFDTYTVTPRPLSSSVSLAGAIEPLGEINVISPFQGHIKERYFTYGAFVKRGTPLLLMDTNEIEIKLREATSAYIKARKELEILEGWSGGTEVLKARRSLASAANKMEENKLLYEKGIVSRNEYESAREQYINQKEELQTVLKKGSEENVKVLRLEFENARSRLERMRQQVAQSVVKAPVSGIVIKPTQRGEDKAKTIERGISVAQGDLLLSIGDLSGLTVRATVDEVDIGRVKIGQTVIVTGDAFLSTPLHGEITHISAQAQKSMTGLGIPLFSLHVTVKSLTPEQKEIIRLGMSANLQVLVYNNPQAVLVPIGAIRTSEGRHFAFVWDPSSGERRETEVETGITTLDSVEITRGIVAGDRVAVPRGSSVISLPSPDTFDTDQPQTTAIP